MPIVPGGEYSSVGHGQERWGVNDDYGRLLGPLVLSSLFRGFDMSIYEGMGLRGVTLRTARRTAMTHFMH